VTNNEHFSGNNIGVEAEDCQVIDFTLYRSRKILAQFDNPQTRNHLQLVYIQAEQGERDFFTAHPRPEHGDISF
jgi:hypothetical protein